MAAAGAGESAAPAEASSRICVKGLPKRCDERRLREHFSSRGAEVTDVRIMKTKEGRSRLFGFVGFRTPAEAEEARKYFARSFIDTSRISIEAAKSRGDATLARPWSRHSKGSSAWARANPTDKAPAEGEGGASPAPAGAASSKSARAEAPGAESRDAKLEEFLGLMQPNSKKRMALWSNDDRGGPAAGGSAGTPANADATAEAEGSDDDYDDIEAGAEKAAAEEAAAGGDGAEGGDAAADDPWAAEAAAASSGIDRWRAGGARREEEEEGEEACGKAGGEAGEEEEEEEEEEKDGEGEEEGEEGEEQEGGASAAGGGGGEGDGGEGLCVDGLDEGRLFTPAAVNRCGRARRGAALRAQPSVQQQRAGAAGAVRRLWARGRAAAAPRRRDAPRQGLRARHLLHLRARRPRDVRAGRLDLPRRDIAEI